jgi:hypothetical protein
MQKQHVMKKRTALAVRSGVAVVATALTLGVLPTALASATTPKVNVRVEGASKTLLAATSVQTNTGWVVKGGHGSGKCPATSAQGALNDATHGRWAGKWYPSYGNGEWEIMSILGEKPPSTSQWWEMFVNGAAAQAGACATNLKPGDRILFALVGGNGEDAIGVTAPTHVTSGKRFAVKVVYYVGAKHHALAGATVKLGTHSAKTNSSGIAKLTVYSTGKRTLTVSKHGYVRNEAIVRVAA